MHLYDVNLLLAMLTPDHEHHAEARAWRLGLKDRTWATCGITVAGFVRLACNPALGWPVARIPADAWSLLHANMAKPGHHFIGSRQPPTRVLGAVLERCQGYRQVTDAVLLALAIGHRARLATFDARLRHLAPDPAAVTVVPLL